jgi:hypothetical protein
VLYMISDRELTQQQIAPVAITGFTLAFSLHAVVAEIWIRASRRKRAPAAGAAQARAQGQADVVSQILRQSGQAIPPQAPGVSPCRSTRRNALGGTPTWRLKARLNEASLS